MSCDNGKDRNTVIARGEKIRNLRYGSKGSTWARGILEKEISFFEC